MSIGMQIMERVPKNILSWIILAGLTLSFLFEFLATFSEFVYVNKKPIQKYQTVESYVYHEFNIDKLRLNLFALLVKYLGSIILVMSLGAIWQRTEGNILFLLVVTLVQLIFVSIPIKIVEQLCVLNKYGGWNELGDVLSECVSQTIDEFITSLLLLGILHFIAKITKLDRLPDDPPIPEDAEEARRVQGCCAGKFWIVLLVITVTLMICIQASAVDIFVQYAGESNFVPMGNWKSSNSNSTNEIRHAMKELVGKAGFPYDDVYVYLTGDSPNAAFMGITKKRIIIFSSLMPLVTVRQLCAVVAHELGHWSHGDVIKMAVFAVAVIVFICAIVKLIQMVGLSTFGLPEERLPVIVVLLVTEMFFSAFSWLLTPMQNGITRAYEYNADCYAAKMGYPIAEALTVLTGSDSMDTEHTWLYEMMYLDHPQLSNRVKHIGKCVK